MAEVLLFHHVLGLTPGVESFAERLRASGHTVHVPDLFDGQTFATIQEGAAFAGEVGFEALIDRGVGLADDLPAGLVYAGFSMGVLPAQKLAQTRPGARGALLFESCVPTSEFGDGWPKGVPVQIHGMDADPFFAGEGDIDAARALVEDARESARAELFVYRGDVHLFTDSSLPSFDAEATASLTQRVLDFLGDVT
ncbi:MAG: dienelactone hydrolase family protein [Acidimicrobiia bacterium]